MWPLCIPNIRISVAPGRPCLPRDGPGVEAPRAGKCGGPGGRAWGTLVVLAVVAVLAVLGGPAGKYVAPVAHKP